MRNHVFGAADSYPVALLIKPTSFKKDDLIKNYVEPLKVRGLADDQIFAMTLEYNGEKKVKNGFIKEYCAQLLPELKSCGVKYMLVADAEYFKYLAKRPNADSCQGYVLPCAITGYESMNVVLVVNHSQLIYKPELREKLEASLDALVSHVHGRYQAPGTNIIHKAVYPETVDAIRACLEKLMSYPALTIDIEAFSLRFYEAGIGTIAFGTDQHRFVAFPCDYKENQAVIPMAEKRIDYGRFEPNAEVRALLKWFFMNYKGKMIWHNTGYDVKVIIYTLFMRHLGDTEGLLEGLEYMTKNVDDTKIIAYLATNTTAGNVLGLKPLAHEFAGNWAVEDIKDIRKIPLKQLLQYNGVDTLSTWYVHNKYYQVMVRDQQEELYFDLMLPSQKLIHQIELTGMPMNKARITLLRQKLEAIEAKFMAQIMAQPIIKQFEDWATDRAWHKDYENRKGKAVNPDKIKYKDRETFPQFVFNPGSPQQLQHLLYKMLGLPVIDLTDTKQPATGEKTLEKLLDHPIGQANKDLIEGLIGVSQVSTILSTFIPAFERGIAKADDGIIWLFGSFNIGGTVSGRLSSSDPNMQNIPAKSIFAKLIKECFMAPEGWLFCGADFNSLEDMISALTTKDPNKLAVYTQGFDGHSLRAAYYFQKELIQQGIIINLTDPKSVNQLKKMPTTGKEHPFRQDSKAPTFLLTYGGTWMGMMKNLGWTEVKSKAIEANYHKLYAVSDKYIYDRIVQASKDGYGTVAFGLRVRAPLLGQVIYDSYKMPYEAAAEARTLGNAFGQSWGLLNNRAMVAFMKKVWASPYRLQILPCSLIHDAGYLLLKRDLEVVEWANKHYIEEMRWQAHPEIDHPTVKLGAALDIFYPSWPNAITIPNDADQATIKRITDEAMVEYRKPKEKA